MDDHEDDNDDEGREDDNKRVCRGAPLVITLSSIVGIGTASKDLQLERERERG